MMYRESRQTVGAVGGGQQHDSSGQRPSHAYSITSMPLVQELRAGASGKVVASIEGDVLRKAVLASKHFLRTPRGIAFDVAILDAARRAGVTTVEVYEREQQRTYTATLADFERWGVPVNRGFGAQRALPLERWKI